MSDSDSDDDSTELNSKTELGFLEKSPSWKLESRFFPSKVGSKPAWLSLTEDIPNSADVLCTSCNKILTFLCQLYAPIEDKAACFHRMLYIFICKNENCIRNNTGFKVLRNQLARVNKYYPFDPPIEEATWRTDVCAESFSVKLCNVCGIKSTNHCGNCKQVYYCSKDHQVEDWKSGHKQICKKNCSKNSSSERVKPLLFPEYEIITEPEQDISDDEESCQSSSLQRSEGSLQGIKCEDDLSKMAFSEEDKNFMKFREKMKLAPVQVIRYERNGVPLWCSDNNLPALDTEIPNCDYCGGKRIFEFQVMPQLLNYLLLEVSETSLDWGTLVIFTCENSCDAGPNYKVEYLFKQDMS